MDQSVRLEAGDQEGVQRLIPYSRRGPFSQARRIEVTDAGKVIYKTEHLHLLPPLVTTLLSHFKKDVLQGKTTSLDVEETLIALSISAMMNPAAESAIEQLKALNGCEMHLTHIPTPGDAAGLRKLGVNVTSDPEFATKYLFAA